MRYCFQFVLARFDVYLDLSLWPWISVNKWWTNVVDRSVVTGNNGLRVHMTMKFGDGVLSSALHPWAAPQTCSAEQSQSIAEKPRRCKGFVKVRTRMNCSGRRPLPMRNLAVEFGIFKTPCVRYDMDFLRYDMDFLRYGSFLMFTYEHLGVACAKTKQTKTGTSRPSMP